MKAKRREAGWWRHGMLMRDGSVFQLPEVDMQDLTGSYHNQVAIAWSKWVGKRTPKEVFKVLFASLRMIQRYGGILGEIVNAPSVAGGVVIRDGLVVRDGLTVAEHSARVQEAATYFLPPIMASKADIASVIGWIHDLHEAITGDIIGPWKHASHDLNSIDRIFHEVVTNWFLSKLLKSACGVGSLESVVQEADRSAYKWEMLNLLGVRMDRSFKTDKEMDKVMDVIYEHPDEWTFYEACSSFDEACSRIRSHERMHS